MAGTGQQRQWCGTVITGHLPGLSSLDEIWVTIREGGCRCSTLGMSQVRQALKVLAPRHSYGTSCWDLLCLPIDTRPSDLRNQPGGSAVQRIQEEKHMTLKHMTLWLPLSKKKLSNPHPTKSNSSHLHRTAITGKAFCQTECHEQCNLSSPCPSQLRSCSTQPHAGALQGSAWKATWAKSHGCQQKAETQQRYL